MLNYRESYTSSLNCGVSYIPNCYSSIARGFALSYQHDNIDPQNRITYLPKISNQMRRSYEYLLLYLCFVSAYIRRSTLHHKLLFTVERRLYTASTSVI